MTPDALAACALRLRAGAPLAAVADDAATTPTRLRRALRRCDAPVCALREDGRAARVARVVDAYARESAASIAAREGVHVTTVLGDLRRAGVRVRPVGRPSGRE